MSMIKKSASASLAACLLLLLLRPEDASSLDAGRAPLLPAFVSPRRRPASSSSPLPILRSTPTAVDDVPSDAPLDLDDGGGDPEAVLRARDRLLALASSLASSSPSGRFVSRPSDRSKLRKAVSELETLAPPPGERGRELLLGNWKLVATAAIPSAGMRRGDGKKDEKKNKDKKSGWFASSRGKSGRSSLSLLGDDNPLQKSLKKTVEVTQRIRTKNPDEEDEGAVSRVDNVVEITPLDTLDSILPKDSPLTNLLGNVNLNPLSVKKSKVVLVHDAEVESVDPVLRTKIAWVSSVVNVAGTSQYLDPDGADVFGINNLFGEFLNAGTFDTPYVDEDVRVSRSSSPIVEQIRVFVRDGSSVLDDEVMMESLTAELRVEEEREAAEEEKKDVGVQAKKVAEATASMAENARSTIEKDMEGVNKALSETMDDVVGKVQDAVEEDLEQIGKAVQGVQSAIRERGDVGEALSNATEAVAKVPEDVRSIVEEDASNLADEVEGALETMVADVQDSVETDLKEIEKSIEGMRDAVSGDDEEEDETKEE
ncbi:hypothetical protein ACHAWF_006756 [Thalassiosira exigua]